MRFRNIKLEILRPGPAHNQLLSPKMPYLALCGGDGPVTIEFPFEQRQLLLRLERLRYGAENGEITKSQREGELRDFGETIGKIFGEVPALLSEMASVASENDAFVHLRLSFSAYELGLIPFETAVATDGFPGSGSHLLLQSKTPIAMTREIRRGKPLPVKWNRPPKILFVFACPEGLADVPADLHLKALRRAIDPWVRIWENRDKQIDEVKKIITMIPNASLEKIRQACSQDEFTHVHILAHGARYENAGDTKFGIALHNDLNPNLKEVVDGERLAIAMTMDRADQSSRRDRPTVLSLAACDSGNVSSVITPGGSIAHELHAAGIPWVFASQFPLWMHASTIFTEVLYKRLLNGADPRCALHEVRQRLRTSCPATHDWASIVAYATLPWDFEIQVNKFRDQQTLQKINTKFARIDDILLNETDCDQTDDALGMEVTRLCEDIRSDLEEWAGESGNASDTADDHERLGLSAASEKRIGIAYHKLFNERQKYLEAYGKSCALYKKAMAAKPNNHWVTTQYLSMRAILSYFRNGETECTEKALKRLWHATLRINQWQLPDADGIERIWSNATLAELELLGAVYGGQAFDVRAAEENIIRCCKNIAELCEPEDFPLKSTIRQFRRYTGTWGAEAWHSLARAALAILDKHGDRL